MFGNPLGSLVAMSLNKASLSEDDRKLIESTLTWIRSNLENIRNTWGSGSEQYESAVSIMETFFKDEMKKNNVDADIEELMQKMSLDGSKKSTPESAKSKS